MCLSILPTKIHLLRDKNFLLAPNISNCTGVLQISFGVTWMQLTLATLATFPLRPRGWQLSVEGQGPLEEHQGPAQHVRISTSLPALQREITELWTMKMDNIPYLKALVMSMPRRLQDVIRRDGNTTMY